MDLQPQPLSMVLVLTRSLNTIIRSIRFRKSNTRCLFQSAFQINRNEP